MPTDDILAFEVQSYDARAQLVREYRLNSFKDGTLELLTRDRTRTLTKRIWCPDVPRTRLFAGSTVNFFGTALEVVGPADLGTSIYCEERTSSASCVCVVAAAALPALVGVLEETFTALRGLRTLAPEDLPGDVAAALGPLGPASTVVHADVYLAGSLAAQAELAACVEAAGAAGYAPDIDMMALGTCRNAASLELGAEPATLLLAKPHVVGDKGLGPMLGELAAAGFEVAGLQLVSISPKIGHEFFAPYKGVWHRHEDMVAHCLEGPVLAVQVRSDVAPLRDFCGPVDVALAKTLRPKSLRALFGSSVVKNAVHCTDLEDDGFLECNYFFNVLQGLA